MEIKSGSDLILILELEDIKGKPLRVENTAHFKLYVWTANRNNYLVFNKRDINTKGNVDRIAIPDHFMNTLESGVVCYTYDYAIWDSAFKHTDCMYNKVKEVTTDLYWRNCNFNEVPANPVNYQTLEYIKDLIEAEGIERERADKHLEHFVKCEYTDKLNEEVKRSTQVDIEMLNRINSNKELADTAIKAISDKLESEIKRSNEVDVLMYNLIKENKEANTNEAKNLVTVIETKVENNTAELLNKIDEADNRAKQAEKNIVNSINQLNNAVVEMVNDVNGNVDKEESRATLAENRITNNLEIESNRAKAAEQIINDNLTAERNRATEREDALNNKIKAVADNLNEEVERSLEKDREHKQELDIESNRAKAVENKIATDLETEIGRAKDAESHILDEVHTLSDNVSKLATASNVYTKAEVDTKVTDVVNSIATVENALNNHITTSDELAAKVSQLISDVDAAKADILAEVAKCDAENNKLATDIQTLSDSTYTKAEVDSYVNDLNNLISALENWRANHNDNTDELKSKVAQLQADVATLTTDLANEVTARTNENITLNTKVDTLEGKTDSEITRAKSVEKELYDEISNLKTSVNEKAGNNSNAIAEVESGLTKEIADRKAGDKVLSDAIEVINGDVATNGSIKKALQDSKEYTDAEITKLSLAKTTELANTLKDYSTTSEVDKKIADVIGTAPEALDTLGKISSALSESGDAIDAINQVLAGKANVSDVYTKNEVDTTVTSIGNTISSLETKVDNADATINSRIDDLVSKVTAVESTADSNNTSLTDAIAAEEVARKAQDKALSDKIDSVNDALTAKITEVNTTLIEDIAKSDAKDIELEAKIDANTQTIQSEIARAKAVETELNDKINGINLDGAVSTLNESITNLAATVTQLQADSAAKDSQIESDLQIEVARAKAKEQEIADSVSTLSGTVTDEVTTIKANQSATATALSDEVNRAKAKEAEIEASVATEVARATAEENKLATDLQTEVDRAKTAETALSDKIDVINGDNTVIGSIAHAVEDAKHYTDDEISKLNVAVNNSIADEAARAARAEKENADAIEAEANRAKATESEIKDSVDAVVADVAAIKAGFRVENDNLIISF